MRKTLQVALTPQSAVPSGAERVAWLEAHPAPLPITCTVEVGAELALWARAGASITSAGGIIDMGGAIAGALGEMLLELVRSSGECPPVPPAVIEGEAIDRVLEQLGADLETAATAKATEAAEAEADRRARVEVWSGATEEVLIAAVAGVCGLLGGADYLRPTAGLPRLAISDLGAGDAALRERIIEARRTCERRLAAGREAAAARETAAVAAAVADRGTWIRDHGSPRLQLAMELGLDAECDHSYLEERCELELPGWRLSRKSRRRDLEGKVHEPSMTALEALEAARAMSATLGAQLVWLSDHHRRDCDRDDCVCGAQKSHAALACTHAVLGRVLRDDF